MDLKRIAVVVALFLASGCSEVRYKVAPYQGQPECLTIIAKYKSSKTQDSGVYCKVAVNIPR